MADYPSYMTIEKRMHRRQVRQKREKALAHFLLITLGIVLAIVFVKTYQDHREEMLQQQRIEAQLMENRLQELETQRDSLARELDHRNQKFVQLSREHFELLEEYEQMTEVLQWERRQMTITHYAPLDPQAIDGMCFSGDPTITASGQKVEPGITVAAGVNIPFGTQVYIPGYGYREVHDRGGAIGPNSIDVAVATRSEAFRLGRVKQDVYVDNNLSNSR